jgi:hypothetical protein
VAVLDTHWHANPKILALGLDAMGLHAWSISYCDDLLTDGFVPQGALPLLPRIKQAVKALLTAGRWEAAEGGYRLHDYLRYNRSRAEVDAYMAHKVAAGRAGGLAKAQQTASKPPSKPLADAVADALANDQQDLKQKATPFPGDVNSRPPARLAGRTVRPRARGDGDLQPLSTFVVGGLDEMPAEVQQRLGRPAIGQPAKPASPAKNSQKTNDDALG